MSLDEKSKKVLQALARADAPLANKQIANASGLDGKEVTAAVKALKSAGMVDSPARCKYGLTDQGKSAV